MSEKARLSIYPAVEGLDVCREFEVEVDGRAVWVERLARKRPDDAPDWFLTPDTANMVVNIASFGCSGPCKLVISPGAPISNITVQPKRLKIPVKRTGNDAELSLPGPCKLHVDMDGLPPLLVFADALEKDIPSANSTGTRIFGPGVHTIGLLTLKDNEQIYLAPGAIVYGGLRGNPRGARVFGRGILDGRMFDEMDMVSLTGARDIEFNGITVRCSKRSLQNRLGDCENVLYRDVKVLSFVPYGDGIDPINSRNVRIENCFIRCADDCVSIKAFKGAPQVSGITVTGCVMTGDPFGDGVTVGFESDAEYMENITVRDCDILCAIGDNKVGGHSGFSIICDGPAMVRNVRFEDIRVGDKAPKLFEANVTDGASYIRKGPGHIKNVLVKNIQWGMEERPIILRGHDENHLVEDVTFENCTVAGKPLARRQILTNAFVRNVAVSGE
jgi:hypothetical protein